MAVPYLYVHSRYDNWKRNNTSSHFDSKSYVNRILQSLQAKLNKKIKVLTALELQFYRALNLQNASDADAGFNEFKNALYNNLYQRMDLETGQLKNPRGRQRANQLQQDILAYLQSSRFSNTISRGIATEVANEIIKTKSTKNLQKVTQAYLRQQLKKMAGIMDFDKGGSGIQMQIQSYTPQEISDACDSIAKRMKIDFSVALNIKDPKTTTASLAASGDSKKLAARIYSGIAGQIGQRTFYLISEMFTANMKNVSIHQNGQSYVAGAAGQHQMATADITWTIDVPVGKKTGGSSQKTKSINVGMQIKNWDIHGAKTYTEKGVNIGEYTTTSWSGSQNRNKLKNILGTEKAYQALTYILINSVWFQQAGGIIGSHHTYFSTRSYSSNHMKITQIMNEITEVFQILSMEVDTLGILNSADTSSSAGSLTAQNNETGVSKTLNVPAVFWIIKDTMFPLRWILQDIQTFLSDKKTELVKMRGNGVKLDNLQLSGSDALELYQDKQDAVKSDPEDEHHVLSAPGAYGEKITEVGIKEGTLLASKIKLSYKTGLLQQALGRLQI